MISIKYTGTFLDHSGYGSANRAFIAALWAAGLNITTELIVQVPELADHGWTAGLCSNLLGRKIDYKIKIIHLTPDLYPKYMEPDKHNIGHLFWETDRLPKEWIDPINQMQELWVSSDDMAKVFRSCGVTIPMYAFPQPIDTDEADRDVNKFNIPEHKGFLFYSVFQWIERKNPKALLQAYWEAFSGRTDVTLLLKTYRLNYTKEEYEKILLDIQRWKRETRLANFPRVLISTKLLSHEDMMRLHRTGDCYVSADHGEGWCRPIQEAMLMGKPVIATARGGIHEWLPQDNYYPLPSTYVPVTTQSFVPWYTPDQNWAEVDKEALKQKMLDVFARQNVAFTKGITSQNFMKDHFSYRKIGEIMLKRLYLINRALS